MNELLKRRSEKDRRDILQEAKDRFRRCVAWEASARTKFIQDVKFAEADAYNLWQWPQGIQDIRTSQNQPMLTINRVRQHNLDILNDARQSRVAVKVRPIRDGASYDAAEMLDGVIRHIEYQSNANSAYQLALKFAVQGGIGWIRLATDYVGDDTFDQDIFIRQVKDPLTIYLDPDISEFDGSDAKFGFVFTDMPKDEFDEQYPKLKDKTSGAAFGEGSWWSVEGEKVRICEYFRCVPNPAKLYSFIGPDGERVTKTDVDLDPETVKVLSKQLEDAQLDASVDDPGIAVRNIVLTKVEHFKIIGDDLTEENEWPGRYIPLIRCIGEETIIDGLLDRKGHTRAMLDLQRMLNYNYSGSVEYGALQNKVPYIADSRAIEENQSAWETANTNNYAVLTYKGLDDDGNTVERPQRQAPPMQASLFVEGAVQAIQLMYQASGQNQADFGQPGNERSGVAIQQRQRQGDNATYHYLDHQATMVRLCGKQLLDLIGKVYDTRRIIKYRDDAGTEGAVVIDPDSPEAFTKPPVGDDAEPQKLSVLNPTKGLYDVQADVGPAYATKRQEAFQAFSQLLASNKELINLVGDIWMRFADIPGGQEAAERLKRMIPQQALHDGPPPDLLKAQQQIQALGQMMGQLTARLESKEGEAKNAEEKNAIAGYDAVTKRLSALEKALALDPQGLKVLIMEVIEEAQAQSAGGNALEHAMDDDPAQADIHQDLGGQMLPPQPPEPVAAE